MSEKNEDSRHALASEPGLLGEGRFARIWIEQTQVIQYFPTLHPLGRLADSPNFMPTRLAPEARPVGASDGRAFRGIIGGVVHTAGDLDLGLAPAEIPFVPEHYEPPWPQPTGDDNSIPMVAGKPTVLRLYPVVSDPLVSRVTGQVRVRRDRPHLPPEDWFDAEKPWEQSVAARRSLAAIDRGNRSHSLVFRIPEDRCSGLMECEITLSDYFHPDVSDTFYWYIAFRDVGPLRIRVFTVPVEVVDVARPVADAGPGPALEHAEAAELGVHFVAPVVDLASELRLLRLLLPCPVEVVDNQVVETQEFRGKFMRGTVDDIWEDGWHKLREGRGDEFREINGWGLNTLRAEADPEGEEWDVLYVGFIHKGIRELSDPDMYNGTGGGPNTFLKPEPWDRDELRLGNIVCRVEYSGLCHEVIHGLGRNHVMNSCVLDMGTMDAYPAYPNPLPVGSIGEYGFDPDPAVGSVFNPANTYDMMTYCSRRRVSPYNYAYLMERIALVYNRA